MEILSLFTISNVINIFSLIFCLVQVSYKRVITNSFIAIIIALYIVIMFAYPSVDFSAWGSDRTLYAIGFLESLNNNLVGWEFVFHNCINIPIRTLTSNYNIYFFIIALMYTFSYLWISIRLTKGKGTLTMFLIIVSSLFFIAYGTNTIRAGLAMSMLILAFSFYENKRIAFIILAFCAINIHYSMLLTFISFIAAIMIRKPKVCLTIWLLSIILSFSMGNYFEELFANLFENNRTNSYFLADAEKTSYKVGFRWDFVIYSLIPIIVGYYYIIKKKYDDKMYITLYCTYLLANTFWILVIRANFTDRFAYLSWALMPIILIYPLINGNIYKHQNYAIALVVFINVAFTFILSL